MFCFCSRLSTLCPLFGVRIGVVVCDILAASVASRCCRSAVKPLGPGGRGPCRRGITRRPVSRVLSPGEPGRRPFIWDARYRTPRATNPDDGAESAWLRLPAAVSSLFGLAPGGVYRATPVARPPVRSYRTLSPLPRTEPGRFAFCGTFPGVAPAGRYPAPCFHGARTFLHAQHAAAARPTGDGLM